MQAVNERRLSVLVLCDDDRAHASNLLEHLAALPQYSRHRVRLYNARGVPGSRFLDLDAFDAIVIHYSLVVTSDNYLAPWLREKIRAFDGLKVQFLQDEYRWVDDVTAMMRWLGIDVLFSIVPPPSISALYDGRLDGVEIVPTLAGFVPEGLTRVGRLPSPSSRPIDVGYRGRVLPYWVGALSQEKVAIAKGFLSRASGYGLRCDIAWSEADRIYGEQWTRFLLSCRATLGTESGSSLTDFDGSVERGTLAYLDDHPDATFDEVFDAVLAPYEGNVMMNVISPRVFEAAALRTALVLFPGEYGGVVEPERHYIPLEKDFSNMDEVVAAIRDEGRLEELTRRTYDDVIASGRYSLRHFVQKFDEVVSARGVPRATVPRRTFAAARLERPVVTRSIFGVDLLESRQANQRRVIAIGLIRELPALRALARTYMLDPRLRRKVARRRALEDFLRLGLLLREQQGKALATEPFYVTPSRDEPGTLMLSARPRDEAGTPDMVDTEGALDLLRNGPVPTILWNHSGVGPLIRLKRRRRNPVGLQVGYYRLLGIYHFGVLEAIAAHHRELVVDALRPLLEAAAEPASAPRPVEPPPSPSGSSSSRSNVVLALAFRSLLRSRTRRLLTLYARSRTFRKAISLRALVSDLARLRALHDAWGARVRTVAGIDAERTDGGEELRFTTRTTVPSYFNPWDELDRSRAPTRVVWDNRAAGPALVLAAGRLPIGDGGTHLFRALEAAFAVAPEVAWAAIVPPPRRSHRTSQFFRGSLLVLRALAEPRGRIVLARYLVARHGVDLKPLLVDLVKLRALAEVVQEGTPVGVTVQDGCVTFVTNGHGRDPLPARGPERVVWDHSDVGATVQQAGLTLSLGTSGKQEFQALVQVLRHASPATWQALLPAAPGSSQHPTGMPQKE